MNVPTNFYKHLDEPYKNHKSNNSQAIHCEVKIPIYIQSRFNDVASKWNELPAHQNKSKSAQVVTLVQIDKEITVACIKATYLKIGKLG
jgi:hypothetical protein